MREKHKYDRRLRFQSFDFTVKYIFVLTCFALLIGCSRNRAPEVSDVKLGSEVYYCPMHPDVISDRPGKCPRPECKGMALVLKTADTLLERVLKPVNNSVLASVRTIKPVYKKMNLDIQADGYIDYDSRRRSSISSLYSGRIEKLYVKYNYQPIHKGQKVFEIYSPELVTDQENLVSLLTNSPDEETLIEAAKQKLKLLGFSDILLKNLLDTKKVIMAVPVFSDYEGFLYEVPSYTKPSGNMTPMGSKQKNNLQDNPQLSVKEGQYVAMGESIFDIVNVKIVAVILQINQEDISKVNTGQQVEISFDNDTTPVKGKIDFIEPLFKDGIKSLSARVYIENTNLNYKIGALVRAKIKGESFETLWIPASAVMDLGQEKKVWLKKNGYFVAKKVETGMSSNNSIEISDGLTEDSEIAVEAHYLIDSEGFIKTNEDEE